MGPGSCMVITLVVHTSHHMPVLLEELLMRFAIQPVDAGHVGARVVRVDECEGGEGNFPGFLLAVLEVAQPLDQHLPST